MNEYIIYLTQKHRSSGLVIDTNLLVLYLVGHHDQQAIAKFKRTSVYTPADYVALVAFAAHFRCVVTTPNILTEVSNLTETYNAQIGHALFPSFRHVLAQLSETHIASLAASQGKCFQHYGLTDACIHELAKSHHLVLTDDLPFFRFLESLRLPVVNFNHIRSVSILKQRR